MKQVVCSDGLVTWRGLILLGTCIELRVNN